MRENESINMQGLMINFEIDNDRQTKPLDELSVA
jgi:hypothetical protein